MTVSLAEINNAIEAEYFALIVSLANDEPQDSTAIRRLLAEAHRTPAEADNHKHLLQRLRGYMADLDGDSAADETARLAHEAIKSADAQLEADLATARQKHFESCRPHRVKLEEVQRLRVRAAEARSGIQSSRQHHGERLVETLLATI